MTSRPWTDPPPAPFEVHDGHLPVVVHVPHAGLHVPSDVRAGVLLDDEALAREQRLMTDHRTDVLAAGAVAEGATAFVNRCSRLVVDPERFLDADEEVMESVGMGAVYTRTAHGEVLRDPSEEERRELLDRFFVPYAAALADTVAAVLASHGRVVLLDLHSYPSRRLPYEVGEEARPQLCIGTDDHTPPWLATLVGTAATRRGWSVARDTPFAGTYVPLPLLGDERVASVMLELRRDLHLDEDAWQPHDGEPEVAAFVTEVATSAATAISRTT